MRRAGFYWWLSRRQRNRLWHALFGNPLWPPERYCRDLELKRAKDLQFVLASLDGQQEEEVKRLWRWVWSKESPFVAGQVSPEGLAALADDVKPRCRRSLAEQRLVEDSLAVARGHRLPWKVRGDPTVFRDAEGRPVHGWMDPDIGLSYGWQKEEFCAFLRKSLAEGVIEEVAEEEVLFVLANFVIQQGEKKRIIYDARRINLWLEDGTVQYEQLFWLELLACPFMSKVDLQSGYYQVPLAEEDRQWVGFRFEGKYFRWKILPFGLSSAPKAFTKLLKVLAWRWRQKGIRVLVYLDDIWFGALSFQEWLKAAWIILADLEDAGLRVSLKKLFLGPYAVIEFLGLLVDGVARVLFVPERKIAKLLDLARDVLNACPLDEPLAPGSAKSLQKFLGLLSFCGACMKGTGVFRRLLDDALSQFSKGVRAPLGAARDELSFWLENASSLNGRPLASLPFASFTLVVDTSDVATGALVVKEGRMVDFFRCPLGDGEESWSSTARELVGLERAVNWVVEKFGLSSSRLLCVLDSACAVACGNRLAMGRAGLKAALARVWALQIQRQVDVVLEWHSRWYGWLPLADWLSKNQQGEPPSRVEAEQLAYAELALKGLTLDQVLARCDVDGSCFDSVPQMLRPSVAEEVVLALVGPQAARELQFVDVFAEEWNAQPWCQAFCSRRFSKESLGNAWCLDWEGRALWAFPPDVPQMLARVLSKWASCRSCLLILVVPDAPWSPAFVSLREWGCRSVAVPLSISDTDGKRLLRWSPGFDKSDPTTWEKTAPSAPLRAWLLSR